MKRYIILLAALIAGIAYSQVTAPTIAIEYPTQREDGTPFNPSADVAETVIRCDGTASAEFRFVGLQAEFTPTGLTPGSYTCLGQIIDTDGRASGDSNPVSFTIRSNAPPLPPIISIAEAGVVIVAPPPSGGGGDGDPPDGTPDIFEDFDGGNGSGVPWPDSTMTTGCGENAGSLPSACGGNEIFENGGTVSVADYGTTCFSGDRCMRAILPSDESQASFAPQERDIPSGVSTSGEYYQRWWVKYDITSSNCGSGLADAHKQARLYGSGVDDITLQLMSCSFVVESPADGRFCDLDDDDPTFEVYDYANEWLKIVWGIRYTGGNMTCKIEVYDDTETLITSVEETWARATGIGDSHWVVGNRGSGFGGSYTHYIDDYCSDDSYAGTECD